MKVLSTGVLLATLLSGVQAFVPFKAPVAAPVQVRPFTCRVMCIGLGKGKGRVSRRVGSSGRRHHDHLW